MADFPFGLIAYDKWSRLKINETNAPQLWQGMLGWGGVIIYNGNDESIGGGQFGRDGSAELDGAPSEEIGPPPYYAEIHGFLCDKQYFTITPGSTNVYLDVYSIKDFSFWDNATGAPIGFSELFGGLIQVRMLINGEQAKDIYGGWLLYSGDGSFVRFLRIKPGVYDLEITGPYFIEAQYEENVTVGLMEAFEPTTSFYYTNPALPQVKQPTWADYKLTWEDVENASSYIVRLYNAAGGVVATQTIAPDVRIADFSSELSAGTFTATVQASEVAISE